MKISVHTGHNIKTAPSIERRIAADLAEALDDFNNEVTSVVVHVSDISVGRSTGNVIRCLLEVVQTRQPLATVSHEATTQAEALGGATRKLEALLTIKRGHLC